MLAVFIGKNLAYSTSIWFFKDFGETNVAVIVLITFAAGIVFALLCILLGKIIKDSRAVEKENEKEKILKEAKKENKKKSSTNAEVKAAEEKPADQKAIESKPAEAKGGLFDKLFSFTAKEKAAPAAAPKDGGKKDEADNGKADK